MENTLLDWAYYPSGEYLISIVRALFIALIFTIHRHSTGGRLPVVKLCDFGLSKSAALDSQPRSLVGTIGYTAPEVLSSRNSREYDGTIADIWSCGVVLFLMLYGFHPFVDPEDPDNHSQTILRVVSTKYTIPETPEVSDDVKNVIKVSRNCSSTSVRGLTVVSR